MRIPVGRKAFELTGDVAAMYTNIPKHAARELIGQMLLGTTLPRLKVDAVMKCVDMATDHTYVMFADRFF